MPKMISDPEAKDPFKGYKPEKLGSGIRVDGKPLKDEPAAKKDTSISGGLPPLTSGDRMAKMAKEADAKAADRDEKASRTNAMGDTYAKGGSVGSASRRADGCATKGKTRGKFC